MKTMKKNCAYCGEEFEGSRRRKYCKDLHRNYAGQKKWLNKQAVSVVAPKRSN